MFTQDNLRSHIAGNCENEKKTVKVIFGEMFEIYNKVIKDELN